MQTLSIEAGMTVEKFCELLKVHREKRAWRIYTHADIESAATIRGHTARGSRKDCPLTFLAYVLTGRRYYPRDYQPAARRLGIPPSVAVAIAEASDFQEGFEIQPIRGQILRALEL